MQKNRHAHTEMISPHCATLLPALKDVRSRFDKTPLRLAYSVPYLFWLQNGHFSWPYFEIGALLQTLNVFPNILGFCCPRFIRIVWIPWSKLGIYIQLCLQLWIAETRKKKHEDFVRYKTGKKCLTVIIKRLSNNPAFPSILIYSKPLFLPPLSFESV